MEALISFMKSVVVNVVVSTKTATAIQSVFREVTHYTLSKARVFHCSESTCTFDDKNLSLHKAP